jgi:hypothetical protein
LDAGLVGGVLAAAEGAGESELPVAGALDSPAFADEPSPALAELFSVEAAAGFGEE